MAMRPIRGGGGGGGGGGRRRARGGVVQPVYEDFRPMSEWKHDEASHILVIHLPGFMKEQVKVVAQGRNVIRVHGERLVAGNKWSRFNQEFRVPGDGPMDSLQTKYEGGDLIIKVPKHEAAQVVGSADQLIHSTDIPHAQDHDKLLHTKLEDGKLQGLNHENQKLGHVSVTTQNGQQSYDDNDDDGVMKKKKKKKTVAAAEKELLSVEEECKMGGKFEENNERSELLVKVGIGMAIVGWLIAYVACNCKFACRT